MWSPSGHGPDEDGTADKHNRGMEDRTPQTTWNTGAPAELETEGMKNPHRGSNQRCCDRLQTSGVSGRLDCKEDGKYSLCGGTSLADIKSEFSLNWSTSICT
ncbi:unnamed protein product [Arctogadus glacialis]